MFVFAGVAFAVSVVVVVVGVVVVVVVVSIMKHSSRPLRKPSRPWLTRWPVWEKME